MKAIKFQLLLFAGIFALFTVACDGGSNRKTTSSDEITILVGEDGNKVWKIRREISNAQQPDSLSLDEKNDQIHFYTNNRFTIQDADRYSEGTWSYDGTTLVMEYDTGITKGPTATYVIEEMTKSKMRWRSSDGTELVLVDKDFR